MAMMISFGLGATRGAAAQSTKHPPRIAILEAHRDIAIARFRELGLREGLHVEFPRLKAQPPDSYEAALDALVSGRFDLILVSGTPLALDLVRKAPGVPIVFYNVSDPVASGVVASYRRPGGMVTGVSNRASELMGKRLELLKEISPRAARLSVVLWDADRHHPVHRISSAARAESASRLGLALTEVTRTDKMGDDEVWDAIRKSRPDCIYVTGISNPVNRTDSALLARLARASFPAMFLAEANVESGGLMSLGSRDSDQVRRAVDLAARILRGEKPGEIPVDQLAMPVLTVNLGTARSMGITVPQSILLRADRLIE